MAKTLMGQTIAIGQRNHASSFSRPMTVIADRLIIVQVCSKNDLQYTPARLNPQTGKPIGSLPPIKITLGAAV